MLVKKLAIFAPLVLLGSLVGLPDASNAQCVSGRYTFDGDRMYRNGYIATPPVPESVDPEKYDFTVDYGSVTTDGKGRATLDLVRNGDAVADGARISTTRYMHYGKITVRMQAIPVAGVISTFITMSDVKDEIDYEMLGAYPEEAQTVVFYRGIPEVSVHGGIHNFPGGTDMSTFHDYTIDWQEDVLKWYIDGVLVRTLIKEESISPRTPAGKRWYPDTPSIIQFAVWDGGSSANKGTSDWAGGKIPWKGRDKLSAVYEYVDIQCAGDDAPVATRPVEVPSKTTKKTNDGTTTAATSSGSTLKATTKAISTGSTTKGTSTGTISATEEPTDTSVVEETDESASSGAQRVKGSWMAFFVALVVSVIFVF